MKNQKNYKRPLETIKFRGKRADNGEWVVGSLVNNSAILGCEHESNPAIIYLGSDGRDACEVLPETVGQYTGLKDKKGKEIWEGDITDVDDTPFNVYSSKYKGEVVMCNGCWSVKRMWDLTQDFVYSKLFFDDFANKKTEVIGNIYDNPELLKGGQE